MANLGTARTKNFQIGNAELRIGRLEDAGRLIQENHSVGLLQSANVNFSQQVTELKGGLPLQVIDSVVTETSATVTANAYEYTRKNIRAMLNEGFVAASDEKKDYAFSGTLAAIANTEGATLGTTAATTITEANSADSITGGFYGDYVSATGVADSSVDNSGLTYTGYYTLTLHGVATAAGVKNQFNSTAMADLSAVARGGAVYLGIYPEGKQEHLSIVRVRDCVEDSAGAPHAGSVHLVLDKSTPLLFDFVKETKLVVYTLNAIGVGKSTSTEYYTLDVISKNHSTNLVQGFRFWKASISGGMDYAFSNDSFAVTPLSFKILLPAAEEYATGGKLAHVADFMGNNPLGMFWNGQA